MSSYHSGTYPCSDSLENFQFRVVLEHKGTVFGALPPFADFVSQAAELNVDRTRSTEEISLSWMQKVNNPCSAREVEGGAESVGGAAPVRDRRIFTYVEGDQLPNYLKEEPTTSSTTSGATSSALSQMIANSKSRRVADLGCWRTRNPVVDIPQKEHQIRSRTVKSFAQSMYVMAYLGPLDKDRTSYDVNDERVICRITAIEGSQLVFEPDVPSAEVRLESRYGIYNAKMAIHGTKFDQIPQTDKTDELIRSREEAAEFDLPQEGVTKMNYFVEIKRALNFDRDGLCIEYQMEVPRHFAIVDGASARGNTQISYSRPLEQDDIANFSHIFAFSVETQNCGIDEKFMFPRMLLRVRVENAWGRHFVDGYGIASFPSSPGRHKLRVECWRPVQHSDNFATLYERFVSQAADLNSVHLIGANSIRDTQGKTESRIGLTTSRSGQVEVEVQCVIQSRRFISRETLQEMKYGTMMRRIGLHSDLHWRILKVLLEFEEARKRLLKLRSEPLPRLRFITPT